MFYNRISELLFGLEILHHFLLGCFWLTFIWFQPLYSQDWHKYIFVYLTPLLINLPMYWKDTGKWRFWCFSSVYIYSDQAKESSQVKAANQNLHYSSKSILVGARRNSKTELRHMLAPRPRWIIAFTSEWTRCTCDCRLPFWEKAAGQKAQAWGFSPVCLIMWVCRAPFWLKAFPHSLHLKGLSPARKQQQQEEER